MDCRRSIVGGPGDMASTADINAVTGPATGEEGADIPPPRIINFPLDVGEVGADNIPLEVANNLELIVSFPVFVLGDASGGRNEFLDKAVLTTLPELADGVVGFPRVFRLLNELLNCGDGPLVGGFERDLLFRTGDTCESSFSLRKPISRNRVIHSGSGPGSLGLGEGSEGPVLLLLRFWNF